MSEFERYYIVAPLLKLADANTEAHKWEPDTGRNKTFGMVRLSTTGTEPATFTACCTMMEPEMLEKLMIVGEGLIFSKILAEKDGWDWETVLEAMALQEIRPLKVGEVIK